MQDIIDQLKKINDSAFSSRHTPWALIEELATLTAQALTRLTQPQQPDEPVVVEEKQPTPANDRPTQPGYY